MQAVILHKKQVSRTCASRHGFTHTRINIRSHASEACTHRSRGGQVQGQESDLGQCRTRAKCVRSERAVLEREQRECTHAAYTKLSHAPTLIALYNTTAVSCSAGSYDVVQYPYSVLCDAKTACVLTDECILKSVYIFIIDIALINCFFVNTA